VPFTPVILFWRVIDIDFNPASGSVGAQLTGSFSDQTHLTMAQGKATMTFDANGTVAIVVPVNDDTTTSPQGTSFTISPAINQSSYPAFSIIASASEVHGTLRFGVIPPVAGTGVDGDWYLDTAHKLLYGPKGFFTAGQWPPGTTVVNLDAADQAPAGVIDLSGAPPALVGPAAASLAAYLTIAAALAVNIIAWTLAQAFEVTTATRDGNEAITSADVVWPDGTSGEYTADVLSTDFPGATDSYHVTYSPVVGRLLTITQPEVTRDSEGAVIAQPLLVVS
jgi:hypothetical protein